MLTITVPVASGSPRTGPATTAAGSPKIDSAARYPRPRRGKAGVIFAMLLSASVHCILIFGVRPAKKTPRAAPKIEVPTLALVIPQLKELEEPEPLPSEDTPTKPDLGTPTPMLADTPRIPAPNDFVQPLDLSSLIDRPDLSQVKIFVIPEHINRSGRTAGAGAGDIFNLADLDRKPEVVFQPPPIFPQSQKQYVSAASVSVIFIVYPDGRVGDVMSAESTHSGFEESAVVAVQQWRFRPGMKGGRKVSTRMIVPINFHIVE
jgi:protein TonB